VVESVMVLGEGVGGKAGGEVVGGYEVQRGVC